MYRHPGAVGSNTAGIHTKLESIVLPSKYIVGVLAVPRLVSGAQDKRLGSIFGPLAEIVERRRVPDDLEHDLGNLDRVRRWTFKGRLVGVEDVWSFDGVGDVGFVVGAVQVDSVPTAVLWSASGRAPSGKILRWKKNIRPDPVANAVGEMHGIHAGILARSKIIAPKVGAGIASETGLGRQIPRSLGRRSQGSIAEEHAESRLKGLDQVLARRHIVSDKPALGLGSESVIKNEAIGDLLQPLVASVPRLKVQVRRPVIGKVGAVATGSAGRQGGNVGEWHRGVEGVAAHYLMLMGRWDGSGVDQRVNAVDNQLVAAKPKHGRPCAIERREPSWGQCWNHKLGRRCRRRRRAIICSRKHPQHGNGNADSCDHGNGLLSRTPSLIENELRIDGNLREGSRPSWRGT